MNLAKRIVLSLSIIIISMLIIPLIVVATARPENGMFWMMVLYFIVYPIVSVSVGVISGKDIKHLWCFPVFVAVMYMAFMKLVVDGVSFDMTIIYFILSAVSMLVVWKKEKHK